ncbi:sugar MFS transporter [Phenylobacterium sp.]|uniref:sugar MFS transporter n=1 Tax=Phenylobacterium sp. TaxID=1871053 RepID=UPI002F3EB954
MADEVLEGPTTTDPSSVYDGADAGGVNAPALRGFVFALFFIFGGVTSLNDVIIPKLKELFTLSYAEALLVQSAFFAAYFLISIPASGLVRRVGYMRTAAFGLLTMTAGCLLFVPASASGAFYVFLGALFVLAAGITTVQVVTNPLISMLGPPSTAHSRLTFAQAFNSIGTTVFPFVGSLLILGPLAKVDSHELSGAALVAYRASETHVVVRTYLGLALALLVVAWVVWSRRKLLPETPEASPSLLRSFDLLGQPRFGFGALCIFLYVGAEVAIGSIIVNFLIQSNVLGLGAQAAGKHLIFYWGGAMVGRLVGGFLLRMFSPGKVLAVAAAGAIALITVASTSVGPISGWALLAVGLMNSIMFPTIFSLANEGLGRRAAEGSGLICVAIVGGAIIPPLTGHLADIWNLRAALWLPALCYAVIALFGVYARRPAFLKA